MFRYLGLCIMAVSLSGCLETAGNSFNGPSGTPVNTAKCAYSSTGCLKEASESCKGGPYQVLDSDSHSGGLVADIVAGPVTWYALTYRCGPSDGKLPAFAFRGQQFVDSPDTPPPPGGGATITPPINCTSRRVGGTVQTTC